MLATAPPCCCASPWVAWSIQTDSPPPAAARSVCCDRSFPSSLFLSLWQLFQPEAPKSWILMKHLLPGPRPVCGWTHTDFFFFMLTHFQHFHLPQFSLPLRCAGGRPIRMGMLPDLKWVQTEFFLFSPQASISSVDISVSGWSHTLQDCVVYCDGVKSEIFSTR